MSDSKLEAQMANQIQQVGLPKPVTQYPFKVPGNRVGRRAVTYHFDFCWPDLMVALEAEGGTWSNGRHVTGAGYEGDCRKYSLAAIAGWCVVRVTGAQIRSGEAITLLEKALAAKEKEALNGTESR